MLSKIQLYLSIAAAAVIGILYAMFRIEKAEKKTAETKAQKLEEVVNENSKVIHVQHEIEKASGDVNAASDDDIDSLLSKYDRSRKG